MGFFRPYFIYLAIVIFILVIRHSHPFIPITLINLDRSPDRRFFMSSQLYLYGIPFDRYSAVDGASYTFSDEEQYMLSAIYAENGIENKKTRAIMGCTLSHIQIWKKYKDTEEPIVILEDDSLIHPQFRQIVTTSLNELTEFDPKWEILWLSGNNPGDREIVASFNGRDIYRMNTTEYIGQGAVGYILSPRGVRHFLHKLQKYGCGYASDYFLLHHLSPQHAYGLSRPVLYTGGVFGSTILN